MERGVNCDHATLYRGEAPGIRYTRPIADSADSPGCIHHVHIAAARGDREPTFVCSCAAGLIHMHDCPVLAGLECVHFSAGEEPEQLLDTRAADRLHTELMEDLILAAVNEAGRQVDEEVERLTQGLTAGLKLPGGFPKL